MQPLRLNIQIIHMNGRIYDARLGRFLQADPEIQAPSESQSLNRYTYVMNNPLSYTDPTGYNWSKRWRHNKKYVGAAIALIAAPYAPEGFAAAIKYFAAWGGVSGGVQAAINGTNVMDGILKGAAIAGVSAAAFGRIGDQFKGKFQSTYAALTDNWQKAQWAGAHAAAGGVMSVLQGGKFGHGFISAGIAKAANANGLIPGDGFKPQRVLLAGIIGGTISEITGGKFANGATSAAIAQVVNGESAFKSIHKTLENALNARFNDTKSLWECFASFKCTTAGKDGNSVESVAGVVYSYKKDGKTLYRLGARVDHILAYGLYDRFDYDPNFAGNGAEALVIYNGSARVAPKAYTLKNMAVDHSIDVYYQNGKGGVLKFDRSGTCSVYRGDSKC
jgi:RHS repeat-associated protein